MDLSLGRTRTFFLPGKLSDIISFRRWKTKIVSDIMQWDMSLWCTGTTIRSISDKTSYCKISQSLEAARFVFRNVRSLWILTETSTVVPLMCLSNSKPRIWKFKLRLQVTKSYDKTSYRILKWGSGPYLWGTSLQLIWRQGACRFRLREPSMQIICNDLNIDGAFKDNVATMVTKWHECATFPHTYVLNITLRFT